LHESRCMELRHHPIRLLPAAPRRSMQAGASGIVLPIVKPGLNNPD